MIVYDFTVPTRGQLRPSLRFTPPERMEPKKREQGKPLGSISRELWPSMKVTWHQPREAGVSPEPGPSRAEQEALWVGRLLMPEPERGLPMEDESPLQPLTPALSPEYRGEGEILEKLPGPSEYRGEGERREELTPQPAEGDGYGPMPLRGFEASGRDYPIDPEFNREQLERYEAELKAEVPKAQRNKAAADGR